MGSSGSRQAEWPIEGLESVSACPLCGAKERTVAHTGLRDIFFGCAPGGWTLYKCDCCASAYLDPRPNQQTISLAYSRYYTHFSNEETSGVLRRFWHALRNDYLLAKFGVQSESVLWPGRWLLRLFPFRRRAIDVELARDLERKSHDPVCLLDIGCGNGSYLELARRAGWQVKGLDFDPVAVATARTRGLDVLEGTIKVLDGESECYDRITLSHILEHVFDPWDVLTDCYRLLKPGGVLWLETPNVNSIGLEAFGQYWRGLEPPRHLHLFSRKCLQENLLRVGFANIRDSFSPSAIGAMWRGSRMIVAEAGGAKCFQHSRLGQVLAETRELLYPECREFITLICVKPFDIGRG